MSLLVSKLVELSIGGIDYTNPEMGGEECYNMMSPKVRMISATTGLIACIMPLLTIRGSLQREYKKELSVDNYYSPARLTLLVLTGLIFGVQLGLKFMHRIAIFLLCPCHVQTFTWLYLLAAKPSDFHSRVRELVLHVGFGPVIAIAFPTDDWLVLPFEWEIFWIQHIFIAAMPFFAIWIDQDIYQDHKKNFFDWDWLKVSYFAWGMWHSPFCQTLSLLTMVNVAHMLCTAYSDPFKGPYYMMAIIMHQAILLLIHSFVIKAFAKTLAYIREKRTPIQTKID